MKTCQSKKRHVYPYLALLSYILIVIMLGFLLSVFWLCDVRPADFLSIRELPTAAVGYLCVVGLSWLTIIIVFYCEAFIYLGRFCLKPDSIVLSSPLRRKICLRYDEINYAGIDYAIVNGQYQFWIYLSTCPIPERFWGKINKMHFTKNTVMVVYSQEVYKDFMKVLPENLQKLLEKGTSVVRNRT